MNTYTRKIRTAKPSYFRKFTNMLSTAILLLTVTITSTSPAFAQTDASFEKFQEVLKQQMKTNTPAKEAWENSLSLYKKLSQLDLTKDETPKIAKSLLTQLTKTQEESAKGLLIKYNQLAFEDEKFIKGVYDFVNKYGVEKASKMLHDKPSIAASFPNAANVSESISTQIKQDQEILNSAAKVIKEIGKKNGIEISLLINQQPLIQDFSSSKDDPFNVIFAALGISSADAAVVTVTAAVVTAVSILIVAYANAKAEDFKKPEDGGPSPFKKCMDKASERLQSCYKNAKRPYWLTHPACAIGYTFEVQACLILPQG